MRVFRLQPNPQFSRRVKPIGAGFTLIELLVVIMLIGIMASFVLVALAGATQTAKEDRTRAQIMKIHQLIMEHWEEYQYRRVPPTALMRKALQEPTIMKPRQMSLHRLAALRELMRMEMPSYISDVATPAKVIVGSTGNQPFMPARWRAYRNRAELAKKQTGIDWLNPGSSDDAGFIAATSNQQAECLYLILSQMRDADSSALDFFSENEIGDVDGDGMKEILDAWGNPIGWTLWAPAYESPLQVALVDKLEQHDLFDIEQVGSGYKAGSFQGTINANLGDTTVTFDESRFPRTLYPLIYSSGPDGKTGIVVRLQPLGGWADVNNDPYTRDETYQMYAIGAPSVVTPEALADDITNHYLSTVR